MKIPVYLCFRDARYFITCYILYPIYCCALHNSTIVIKKGRDDYDGSINDETLLLVLPLEPEEDVAGIDANVPLAMSRQFVTTL